MIYKWWAKHAESSPSPPFNFSSPGEAPVSIPASARRTMAVEEEFKLRKNSSNSHHTSALYFLDIFVSYKIVAAKKIIRGRGLLFHPNAFALL